MRAPRAHFSPLFSQGAPLFIQSFFASSVMLSTCVCICIGIISHTGVGNHKNTNTCEEHYQGGKKMERGAPWLKSGEKCGRGARVIAHPDLGVGSNGQGETCNFYIAIHLTPVSGDSSKNLSNKFGCLMFGKVRGRSYPLSGVCVILGRMEIIGCLQEEEGLLSGEEICINA